MAARRPILIRFCNEFFGTFVSECGDWQPLGSSQVKVVMGPRR